MAFTPCVTIPVTYPANTGTGIMHYVITGKVKPEFLSSVLPKLMDYGLYRVASDVNPPRDALAICRAMRVSDEFMRCVNAEETKQ